MKKWKSYVEHGLPPVGKYLFKNEEREFVVLVKNYNDTIWWMPEVKDRRIQKMTHWTELAETDCGDY